MTDNEKTIADLISGNEREALQKRIEDAGGPTPHQVMSELYYQNAQILQKYADTSDTTLSPEAKKDLASRYDAAANNFLNKRPHELEKLHHLIDEHGIFNELNGFATMIEIAEEGAAREAGSLLNQQREREDILREQMGAGEEREASLDLNDVEVPSGLPSKGPSGNSIA